LPDANFVCELSVPLTVHCLDTVTGIHGFRANPQVSCDEHPDDRTLQSKETPMVRSLPPILPMMSIEEVREVTGI
jgi:hypothetical protein